MDAILYIDDEKTNLDVFRITFFKEYKVFTADSTEAAFGILNEHEVKLVITDQRMPDETGMEFIDRICPSFPDVVFMILSAYADFEIVKQALTNGRIHRFLLKPWKKDELKIDINNALERYNYIKWNRNLLVNLEIQNKELKTLKQKLEDENLYLKEEIRLNKNFEDIISEDKQVLKILKNIEQVADSDAPVLINGETGTGKELIARAIHNLSRRRHAAFVCVNCAAIPESLFENELFGHEKGAFTGAMVQKKGKFELADQGTLFLDEIGEIPLILQSKLLRAIQENEIERLGSNRVIKLNLRIVVATNRNLEKEIEQNKFRSDLFYRLNVFPIHLPPLRERSGDIPVLVSHFIKKYSAKYGKVIKSVSKESLNNLQPYSWPGNIRELENIVERAVITSESDQLQIENILARTPAAGENGFKKLIDMERDYITTVLEKTNWKVGGVSGAANLLGLNRTTLIAKMKKLGIEKHS